MMSSLKSGQIGVLAAADFLNVSDRTLRDWDNNGTLPAHHRVPSGQRYYYQEELNAMKGKLSGVTRQEAAKQLGVNPKTLYLWDRYERTDRPRSRYQIGSTRYYSQIELDQYLKSLKKPGHEESL